VLICQAIIRTRWNSDSRMVGKLVISLTPSSYSGSALSFQFNLQAIATLSGSEIDDVCQVVMDGMQSGG
jgi:hypothetical protein